jgi:hypothetical protein
VHAPPDSAPSHWSVAAAETKQEPENRCLSVNRTSPTRPRGVASAVLRGGFARDGHIHTYISYIYIPVRAQTDAGGRADGEVCREAGMLSVSTRGREQMELPVGQSRFWAISFRTGLDWMGIGLGLDWSGLVHSAPLSFPLRFSGFLRLFCVSPRLCATDKLATLRTSAGLVGSCSHLAGICRYST